jgi:hypothetical protein
MTQHIQDHDVNHLSTIAANLKIDYIQDQDRWSNSPFGWLRNLPSRRRGAVFEKLVAELCAESDPDVSASPHSDADMVISGARVEVKGSTLWETGTYTFQQIRDQNYRVLVCLGISPFDAHCWAIPKEEIMRLWRSGEIRSQHGGIHGTDTAWITIDPKNPPTWIRAYGGSLSAGLASLRNLVARN